MHTVKVYMAWNRYSEKPQYGRLGHNSSWINGPLPCIDRSTQRRRRPRPLYVLYRTVREIQIFSRIYFLQSEAFPFVGKEDEITFGNQWQETDIQCFDWITFGVLEVTTIPTETRLV